jgi:hypothetical protein
VEREGAEAIQVEKGRGAAELAVVEKFAAAELADAKAQIGILTTKLAAVR